MGDVVVVVVVVCSCGCFGDVQAPVYFGSCRRLLFSKQSVDIQCGKLRSAVSSQEKALFGNC